MSETNMVVLKASRKVPATGDIFAMRFPSMVFVFGRVINASLPNGPMGAGAILICVYDQIGTSIDDYDESALSPDRLLIAPAFINRLPWTRGYFQTIKSGPLGQADTLESHCFEDLGRGGYVDLDGRPMASPTQPCGVWGLDSYRTIDDEISKALGITLAPEN